MAISDRTRKLLWGQSGNRCARCFRVLSVDETELDDPSIVGEECHIISGRRGPRADANFPADNIDEYGNLILLCRIDHKTVDDQERAFGASVLRAMKAAHERKVARALARAEVEDEPEIADPQGLLQRYAAAYRAFHAADLRGIVATPIVLDERLASTTDVLAAPIDQPIIATGASGSGKTYLLRHIADRATDAGIIPILARASVFSGDIEQLLDRAVAPFENTSYDALRRAARSTGQRLLVIIDALNDCPPALRDRLREALVALARTPGHVLAISSTDDPLLGNIAATIVRFAPLTETERAALFTFYAPRVDVEPSVLAAFGTPFEIAIAAETVRAREGRIPAYDLLDRFVAHRLNSAERPAHVHALLEQIAHEMSRTYRATISHRTLVRLADTTQSPNPLGDIEGALRSGLLRAFGSDITFTHEQVQIFFEAASFLGGRGVAAMTAIAAPEKRRLAPFVLGGLEDADEIRACARALADAPLFGGMLRGSYGVRAQTVVHREALTLLAASERAMRTAAVTIERDTRQHATLAAVARFNDLPVLESDALALLGAIGGAVRDGMFLDGVLALFVATEARVYRVGEPRDRPSLLADLFVFHHDRPPCAASVVMLAATVGIVRVSPAVQALLPHLEPLSDATDAALYLACSLLQQADISAADAIRIFEEAWKRDLYHLSLEALDLLQFRRSSITEDEAEDIRNVLHGCSTGNILLNAAVTDVMLVYDMLESPISEDRAAEDFAALVAMPDSEEAFALAYGLVGNCFEDVFQGTYLQALRALTPDDEVVILTRAALGAEPSGFHVEWILHRLLTRGDARALPAYLRWAVIDPARSVVPQSATVAFFASVAACARLGHPFTTFPAGTKNHEAWIVLAEIVFIMHGGASSTTAAALWQSLIGKYASEAVEPLKYLAQETRNFDGCGIDLHLATRFPKEFVRLLEEVVRRGIVATSIRDHGAPWLAQEAPTFVFGKLATIGGTETLPLLHPLVGHPQWGVDVVNTIRAIQSR